MRLYWHHLCEKIFQPQNNVRSHSARIICVYIKEVGYDCFPNLVSEPEEKLINILREKILSN